VSNLPGAKLSSGVFVACGAVVAKGEYADGCRIMGVPGRAVMVAPPPRSIESPSIALVVPGQGMYEDAARLLIEALGLPQVRVFRVNEKLPASVHAAVAVGPQDWSADTSAALWTLHDGEILLADGPALSMPGHNGGGREIRLPAQRRHVIVPALERSRMPLDNAAALTLYYALKRLRKRHGDLTNDERLELYIAACILRKLNGPRLNKLADEFLSFLPAERTGISPLERKLRDRLAKGAESRFDRELAEVIVELTDLSEAQRQAVRNSSKAGCLGAAAMLACPELPLAGLLFDESAWPMLRPSIAAATPQFAKASQLAMFGAAALFANDENLLREITDQLLAPSMLDAASMCVRSAPGAAGSSYSPVLAAVLVAALRQQRPEFTPSLSEAIEERLVWRAFSVNQSARGADWRLNGNDASGVLIDAQRRLISRSLLDNWLAVLRVPPLPDGRQFELTEENYEPAPAAIESIWLAFFRQMQHAAGRSLLRLRPWPFGCRAALSLRYDIDRNTSAEQVRRIIQIQARQLNAACGTWYAIAGTEYGRRVANIASLHLQEIGVHALSSADAVGDCGVTCHSAPSAEYWRGESTLSALERGDARYAEMFAAQLVLPRRAWIGDQSNARTTTLPLLPIHFPLEGSTSDTTLEYFDRLVDRFRQLIESGGHAIIGSHPDLDQAI
jgi:hypothetical protein